MKSISTLFAFTLLCLASAEIFIFEIKAGEMNCIGEFLSHTSHTVVSIHTHSNPTPFILSINGDGEDEQNYKLFKSSLDVKKGLHSLNINFNPYNSTTYHFCLQNEGEYEEKFVFSLVEGIDARDYNETFGKRNWTDVDLKAKKIYDQVRLLKDKFRDLEKDNDRKFETMGGIDYKIFIIGVTSLAVIVILGCLQLQIMLKFFKHKKLV